jgi:hypothetical protein
MSSPWQAAYDSTWHHPGLAWAGTAFAALGAWRRVPAGPFRLVLLLLAAETALDALFTGALSPLAAGSVAAQNVAIAFVIAGDLRLWLLVERFRRPSSWASALARAAPLAFVVPVAQAALIRTWPDVFAEQRRIYLAYELLFCLLAAGLVAARYGSRWAADEGSGWYATRLLGIFLVQYGLWVVSDVLLLAGEGWALGLRLVPNATYYAGFVAFAAWRAPVAGKASA